MKQAAVALLSLLLAACASSPKTDSPQGTPPGSALHAAAETGVIEKNTMASEAERLTAEMRVLGKRSVYFDFDRYVVKPAYRDVVALQSAFIKTHKNDIVTLEGNADERGSNEYNLALGDRRANAVRKDLELLGASAAQIRTISMGEEKPRLSCHEEKCWEENRRCDFVHRLTR